MGSFAEETVNEMQEPEPQIRILSWRPGANAVRGIKAIQDSTGFGLSKSKQIVDDCFSGKSPTITASTEGKAVALMEQLEALGFDTQSDPQATS